MDTFRAADLTDEHLGHLLRADGVDGVLRALRHYDDVRVDVVLDRPPYFLSLPAGRPVEVVPPLDCPPV